MARPQGPGRKTPCPVAQKAGGSWHEDKTQGRVGQETRGHGHVRQEFNRAGDVVHEARHKAPTFCDTRGRGGAGDTVPHTGGRIQGCTRELWEGRRQDPGLWEGGRPHAGRQTGCGRRSHMMAKLGKTGSRRRDPRHRDTGGRREDPVRQETDGKGRRGHGRSSDTEDRTGGGGRGARDKIQGAAGGNS